HQHARRELVGLPLGGLLVRLRATDDRWLRLLVGLRGEERQRDLLHLEDGAVQHPVADLVRHREREPPLLALERLVDADPPSSSHVAPRTSPILRFFSISSSFSAGMFRSRTCRRNSGIFGSSRTWFLRAWATRPARAMSSSK